MRECVLCDPFLEDLELLAGFVSPRQLEKIVPLVFGPQPPWTVQMEFWSAPFEDIWTWWSYGPLGQNSFASGGFLASQLGGAL